MEKFDVIYIGTGHAYWHRAAVGKKVRLLSILGISEAPICYPAIPNLVFTLPRIAQTVVTINEEKNRKVQDSHHPLRKDYWSG